MKQLEKSVLIIIIIIFTASLFSIAFLLNNFGKVSTVYNSELDELHEHTIKLKMDSDSFNLELHNVVFHHEHEDHRQILLDALDLIYLRLSVIEDLVISLNFEDELLDFHPVLRRQLDSIARLIQSIPPEDINKNVPIIVPLFNDFDKKLWELIITTDRLVKESIERSVRAHKKNEIRTIIATLVLFMAVTVLIILSIRYRKNRRELRINEEKLKVVLDSMQALVLGIDSEYRVTTLNKTALQEPVNAKPGMDLYEIFPDFPLLKEEIEENLEKGLPLQCDYRSKIYNEELHEVLIYPFSDNPVSGAVLVITNRSEQDRMKELIAQNEKMLSVGGLAAGMAHEINNPLAGMIQTAAVIRNRLTDEELKGNIRAAEECGLDMNTMKAYLEKRNIIGLFDGLSDSGEQASAIVGNMLDFIQRENSAVSTHNMVQLVERSLELAATDYDMKSYLYFDKIEIIREFEDDLPVIPCSGSRIQQVILNILKNGAEAMVIPRQGPPKGSHFVIRLKKTESSIRLEIEDNGPGMEEDVRKRIFEPFYTTKDIGKGTGLGLSVAYFIISENHQGIFRVKSAPGKGSNFIIELPLVRNEN